LDSNARSIFSTYSRKRERFQKAGFLLGRSPAAILTSKLSHAEGVREPNSYHDMDFYSDHGRSVYRPKFTIEALRRNPKFRYLDSSLAERFEEGEDGTVQLWSKNIKSGERFAVK